MAVTSMRSFASRAIRTDIERELGSVVREGLVPCICKTPGWNSECRHITRNAIPRPLVAPEVALKAWYLLETGRDQPITPGAGRRLGEAIRVDVAGFSQMRCRFARPDDTAPACCQRPDVGRRDLLIGRSEQREVGLG